MSNPQFPPIPVTPWTASSEPGVRLRRMGCFLLKSGPHQGQFGCQVFDNGALVHEKGGWPTLELAEIVAEAWVGSYCTATLASVSELLAAVRANPDTATLMDSVEAAKSSDPGGVLTPEAFAAELKARLASTGDGGEGSGGGR